MSDLFRDRLELTEFPSATLDAWRGAAEAALKGRPLDKLTSKTPDGLSIGPIYQEDHTAALPGASHDPGVFPYVRGARPVAGWRTVTEDGEPAFPADWSVVEAATIHERGGTAVQELAYAWTAGLKIIRAGLARGETVDQAVQHLGFTFAAGGEFFVMLAKLRAARFGWARVVTACGGSEEAAGMVIHARTSRWQQSVLDPHTNILRSTVSAYAAVLGGCDSLAVGAFDEVFASPDDLSRRLAVNTQRILREECHAAAVADAAGGSWFVESLTKELAEAAWAEFQKDEASDPSEAAQAQRQALSRRRRVMVGVNQYANAEERPVTVTRQTGGERLAGEFEARRTQARAYAERHGAPPKIFLLTMGPLRQHKARADFVRGFLEPGGFTVDYPAGFESAAVAVEAARQSGALAAVLCSTDATYPELVPAVLEAMGGALPVILAGYPTEQLDTYRDAGIADFIHLQADCGAFLATWQDKLGVHG